MTNALLPIWLIVLIIALPQLAETAYSPSLPNIATALNVTSSMVEYTLTVYLFGFAIGTLFWGKLSDSLGRKPCVLSGLFICISGCIGCYFSHSIEFLMISRFIQAFGASICSVLGQAICRDVFHGPALSKAYSSINSGLPIFPVIGSIVGGVIAQKFGWENIFLFLIFCVIALSFIVTKILPETYSLSQRKPISLLDVAVKLLKDKEVVGLGLIVAASNGISFSYFAEGSFYLIKLLGLSPSQYGLTFAFTAVGGILGGIFSKKLHNYRTSKIIMRYGIITTIIASTFFSFFILLNTYISIPNKYLIAITIFSQMIMVFGICIINSNSLALALQDYKWCIGTASSLFGFFYYCGISLVTLIMGILRNGTLLPMPLYFFTMSMLMLLVQKFIINNKD